MARKCYTLIGSDLVFWGGRTLRVIRPSPGAGVLVRAPESLWERRGNLKENQSTELWGRNGSIPTLTDSTYSTLKNRPLLVPGVL